MVFFLYKCYYVFFLHYESRKNVVSWHSAIAVLAATTSLYEIALMELFGVLDVVHEYTMADDKSLQKGKLLLFFVIPLCMLIWYTLKYVIFTVAKASKTDGLSERFSFAPNKQDKIICWLASILSVCMTFTIVGIKALHGLP